MKYVAPKSLKHAIFKVFEAKGQIIDAETVDSIERSIRDFLAQRFQSAILEDDAAVIKELWERIIK